MTNRYRFEQQFFQYLQNIERSFNTRPLYLGGVGGSGGGVGGANIIGTLPQTRVSYDLSELAVNTTSGAPSLLDNLNHIRYDIAHLSGAGSGSGGGHIIYDEDIELTQREKLVLSGAGVIVVDNESNDSTDIIINPDFLDLIDTPASYGSQALKVLIVSETEDGIDFATIASSGGNKIVRYDAGGTVLEEYDVDETGLRAALVAAVAGDIVLLPPQTITIANDGTSAGVGSLKINEGVTLKGMSREYSKITATIVSADASPRVLFYCYNDARLENLSTRYERTNVASIYNIYHNYGSVKDTGISLKDVTAITINNSGDAKGITAQIRAYEDRDNVAIDNCSFYTSGSDAENFVETYNSTYWNRNIIIRNSSFISIDDTARTTNYLYGLTVSGSGLNRVIVENCYVYAEISTAATGRNRVHGIYGYGNVEVKNSIGIAKNVSTYSQTETNGISLWAYAYPNYPDDDPLTDLILIENCIGIAHSSSSSVSSSYPTRGLEIGDGTIIGGFYRATCDGSSDQIHGGYIDADNYDFDVRNATFNGDTYDLQVYNTEQVRLYNCQYETLDELGGTTMILQGDRASYYPESYHAEDIEDEVYTRHLPLPTISGWGVMATGDKWVLSDSLGGGGAGSGAGAFTELSDTPSSYADQAGKALVVASEEDEIEFTDAGTGDMLKSVYDANDDGIIDEIPWTNVTGKPATFTPSTHNHDDRYYKETEIDIKFADVDEFLDMDDSPSSYAGQAGKAVIVSDTEDQVEFVDVAGIGSGIEYQVLTSENDEDPDFILNKFIAGSGIVLTETLDEGDGSIIIDTTASGVGDMTKAIYDTNDDGIVNEAHVVTWSGVSDKPSTYPPSTHDHDADYYTETELDGGQLDDRYYTETEIDTALALQDEFIELTDAPSSYVGEGGKVIAIKDTEDGLEFVVQSGAGSGAGASEFTELTDTPPSYIGEAGKSVVVASGETGLEFTTISGGGVGEFTSLTDVPSSYIDQAGKYTIVNETEDALEFTEVIVDNTEPLFLARW